MKYPEENKYSFSSDRKLHTRPGSHVKVIQHTVDTGNELLNGILNQPPSNTDPMGSYTGLPADQYEVPEQDADDL